MDNEAILLSAGLVLVFVVLSMVAFFVDKAWERKVVKAPASGADDLSHLVLSWSLLVALIVLYYMLVMRGASHWFLAKGDFFETTGTIGVAFQFLVFGLHLTTFGLIASCVVAGRLGLVLAGAALAVILILDLLITGNRIMVLTAAVQVVFLLVMLRRYGLLALCAGGGTVLGFALSAFPVFRYHLYDGGFAAALSEYHSLIQSGVASPAAAIFETVNLNVFVALVRDYGMLGAGTEFATFLKPLYVFIPRSIFEGKLDSITVLVGQMYDDRYGVALVPLIFGESYMNVGVFGPALLVLFCVAMNRFIHRCFPSSVSPSVALMAGFLFVRFPFSDLFMFLLMTVPFYFGTLLLSDRSIQRSWVRR